MLRSFVQFTALLLTLLASYFLVKGIISASASDMLRSVQYVGVNSVTVGQVAQEKADTTIGFVLLLLSFTFQTANQLWPIRIGDLGVCKKGVLLAFLFSGITLLLAIGASHI